MLALAAATATIHLAAFGTRGDLIGGWALDANGIRIGTTRVLFPFVAGIVLIRLGTRLRVGNAFAASSLILVVARALPRFGGTSHLWLNGLYEAACVLLLFHLIVAIGAGEKRVDGTSIKVARFFGDLSFPLYITHYPLIYIYTSWVADKKVNAGHGTIIGVAVFLATIALAYGCLKVWDEPLRRKLAAKLLRQSS